MIPTTLSISPTSPSILLVDDNPGVLYSTSKILTNHQFQVVTAANAAEGLAQVKLHNFDLIICDINMPGRNGLEFLNDLKVYDPTLTSVVLTANGTVSMAIQAMRSGALGFITKPFREAELIEAVWAALEQARLVREALQMEFYTPLLESLCNALLNTMVADNLASQGSIQRTAELAQEIAVGLSLPPDEVQQIYLAGLFHDIGKIGIPDKITKKNGPLTPEEQAEMSRHPELSARIIDQTPGMSQAARIILHHHEHYDGSGYPHGLTGEDIPLGSRILAIADVYEELASQTPYLAGVDAKKVLEQIKSHSGTRFDPKVVEMALPIVTRAITLGPEH